jgi:hypothetical protein
MRSLAALFSMLALAAAAPAAQAGPRQDGVGSMRDDLRSGEVRPVRDIEQRVLPAMAGMQYLGPEYDPAAMAYRLKFIRNGRVVFVDVDARSGQILHQSR